MCYSKTEPLSMAERGLSGAIRCAIHHVHSLLGDYARMSAIDEMIGKGGYRGLEGLYATIQGNPLGWVMEDAPMFLKELKLATFKSREEWLEYHRQLEARFPHSSVQAST